MKTVVALLAVCFVLLEIVTALTKDPLTVSSNVCKKRKSCGDCLEAGPECAFCTLPSYDQRNLDRCDLKENHRGCPKENLMFPESNLRKSVDVKVMDGDTNVSAIQIQPQEIELKVRPNDPQRFDLTFRLAENYPVDLYYLMDFSNSMRDDKNKLVELGEQIAAAMKTITKNFRLGFGSFVDKVVMPYVDKEPIKIHSPCIGCAPAYGFKNQLKLDDNTTKFVTEVRAAQISGNIDAFEGGFDAIMQAIVCDNQIGWRQKSRRMVLFSTDAGSHFAGEGKLGGIVKPNDGLCHLDNKGVYTESTRQDYPSVSQISAKIKEKKVNIIFAVTEDMVAVYNELSNFIPGSETGELAHDSSNIVTLVRSHYEKITSKVEMISSKIENITVKFFSKCKGIVSKETNVCENLKIGDTVTFEVEVEVTSCVTDPSKNVQFEISPVGLNDKLVINMSLLCQCDCEKTEKTIPNSPDCSSLGTRVCGTCDCNKGFHGKNCECRSGNLTTKETKEIDAPCFMPNTTLKCSNRGECVCGKCECNPRRSISAQKYSGVYCECDDYICPYANGKLCGGIGLGICECGKCNCNANYTGDACDCPASNDTCMAKGTKPGGLCNGNGDCFCGKCKCFENSQYIGPTCEDCQDCNKVCRKSKSCVQCVVHKTGPYVGEDCEQRGCMKKGFITQQDVLEEGYKTCEFKDVDNCIFYFSYEYDANKELKIIAQRTKECPPKVYIIAVVLGVIGGIVFLNLGLLLIWKIVTINIDNRELARLEREAQNAELDTFLPLNINLQQDDREITENTNLSAGSTNAVAEFLPLNINLQQDDREITENINLSAGSMEAVAEFQPLNINLQQDNGEITENTNLSAGSTEAVVEIHEDQTTAEEGMDPKHKRVLQINSKFIIDNLQNPAEVCDELFAREIINSGMKEDILAKTKPMGQTRHLVTQILPSCGQKAFESLIESFRETANEHISDRLTVEAGLQSPHESSEPEQEMDPEHKRVLQINSKFIIDNLQNPAEVCDELFAKEIINSGMKEDILSKKPKPMGQTRHLVTEVVPRRGRTAFEALIESFRETANEYIADRLVLAAGLQSPSDPSDLPEREINIEKDWPQETDMVKEIEKCTSDDPRLNEQGSTVYYMTKEKKKGQVLMLKNYSQKCKNYSPAHQKQFDNDSVSLDQVLKLAQFEVKQFKNVTVEKAKSILKQYKKTTGFEDYNCFFLILISAGDDPLSFYGTQEEKLTPSDVADFLNECPSLKNKPNLVLMQCYCNEDWENTASGDIVDAATGVGSGVPLNDDDLFIVCCCPEKGVNTWMEGDNLSGSWFIQAFVHVFKNHAHELSFIQMIDEVEKLLQNARYPSKSGIYTKQKVAKVKMLTKCEKKQLYFFPGISPYKSDETSTNKRRDPLM